MSPWRNNKRGLQMGTPQKVCCPVGPLKQAQKGLPHKRHTQTMSHFFSIVYCWLLRTRGLRLPSLFHMSRGGQEHMGGSSKFDAPLQGNRARNGPTTYPLPKRRARNTMEMLGLGFSGLTLVLATLPLFIDCATDARIRQAMEFQAGSRSGFSTEGLRRVCGATKKYTPYTKI